MIEASFSDKQEVINLLTEAFDANRSVNFVVKQDRYRRKRIARLMDYSFEISLRWGKVYLSDNRQAAALILFPHQKKLNISSLWLDLKLASAAIGLKKIIPVMRRESKFKQLHPKQAFIYLWFVGVKPEFQGRGIGSQLLRDILSENDDLNLPVYLETSTPENLPLYQRLGFTKYACLEQTFPVYFFKREIEK